MRSPSEPGETFELFVPADVELLVERDPVERVSHGALLSLRNR